MKTSTSKLVYHFSEGDKDQKDLLGGKGANLAEMSRLGLPVPPGFTITTEACTYFVAKGGYPEGLELDVAAALRRVESAVGAKFGQASKPLLVSVRSGGR